MDALFAVYDISIHALREEGDSIFGTLAYIQGLFLSTPSARRATDEDVHSQLKLCISIHALREEGDQQPAKRPSRMEKFLSTPSARRATGYGKIVRNHARFLSTPSARRATQSR